VLIIFFFLICILKLVSVDSIWSLQTCGVVYGIKKYSITQLVFFRSFFFFREAAIQKLVLIGCWKWHGDFTTCALSLPCRFRRFLCGLGSKNSRRWRCGHGRQAGQGSGGWGQGALACRTSGTQAWRTRAWGQGKSLAEFRQCWGESSEASSPRGHGGLGIPSKLRHSCTRTSPCGWGRRFVCTGQDASFPVLIQT